MKVPLRLRFLSIAVVALWAACVPVRAAAPADALPELTEPVNDFAHVIDPESAARLDEMIRALQAASGDTVVVATVPTIEPYADINEYAVKLFENHGRGIGQKGKNNGVLIVVAIKEHRVRIEVGYDDEQWITDGFAGETSREFMTPRFRLGQFGPGLVAGTERIIGRIAQGRNVSLQGIRAPSAPTRRQVGVPIPFWGIILLFIVFAIVSRIGGGPGGPRYWGGGWGGWSSGVGPFGGGWGGGGGSGGSFGGGFGGFGGGESGGGGGGSSW